MESQFKFVTLLISLTIPFFSNAVSTGHILGQVKEKETGQLVAFANIVFENNMDKFEVQANEYGYYYANHIPTGKYQMRVAFNQRTFIMRQVRVYDSYSSQIDFMVSNSNQFPSTVEVESKEPIITAVASTDIRLTNNSVNQRTQSLGEALSMQPGVEVIDGKLYVKGSDQVRFFIDGTPIMGQPVIGRVW